MRIDLSQPSMHTDWKCSLEIFHPNIWKEMDFMGFYFFQIFYIEQTSFREDIICLEDLGYWWQEESDPLGEGLEEIYFV